MDLWNLCDSVLIICAVISTWILSFVAPFAGENLYVLSTTLRIVRVITAGRLIRVLTMFRDVRVVISGFFEAVSRSMLSLFQIVTLDDWSDGIVRHVVSNQPAMAIFFLSLILLTTYGLASIVVGIIVERTLAAARENQQRYLKNQGM